MTAVGHYPESNNSGTANEHGPEFTAQTAPTQSSLQMTLLSNWVSLFLQSPRITTPGDKSTLSQMEHSQAVP